MSRNSEMLAVIQGPVVSIGRTFETTEIGKTEREESRLVVSFDSSSTILDNIRRFQRRGVDVIYSGWLGDCPPRFRDEIRNHHADVILSNPDHAPSTAQKNSPFKGVLSVDNKSKQFYSLFHALDGVDNLSNRIVIKLRSDISLNIDRLLDEVHQQTPQIQQGGVLVQYLRSENGARRPSIWIPDFWFAGRGDVLHQISRDLLTRSLTNRSYTESPHLDLGSAIARYHYPFLERLENREESLKSLAREGKVLLMVEEVLRRLGRLIMRKRVVSLYRKKLLIPASKEIEHSMSWRGDSYGKFVRKKPEADQGAIYAKSSGK